MLNGFYLIHPGATTALYSPEFPRGGLAANFSLEVNLVSGTPTLVVAVQHRNEDDVGYTTAGTFSDITTTGLATLDVTGLKEIVRFSFSYSSGSANDLMNLTVAAPAWRPL